MLWLPVVIPKQGFGGEHGFDDSRCLQKSPVESLKTSITSEVYKKYCVRYSLKSRMLRDILWPLKSELVTRFSNRILNPLGNNRKRLRATEDARISKRGGMSVSSQFIGDLLCDSEGERQAA